MGHSTVPLIFFRGTVPTQIYTINWCYFNCDRWFKFSAKPVTGRLGYYIKAKKKNEKQVILSQLHILSLVCSLFFLLLKKPQIASSSMSVNFTSSHQRPHLLTTEGFLRDQIVLILFKVRIEQNPNFSVIVLCPFSFLIFEKILEFRS